MMDFQQPAEWCPAARLARHEAPKRASRCGWFLILIALALYVLELATLGGI